jgi:hypothetical protein
MSKDHEDLLKMYDATAAWLHDCIRKNNIVSVKHAESKLRELDVELAKTEGEHT